MFVGSYFSILLILRFFFVYLSLLFFFRSPTEMKLYILEECIVILVHSKLKWCAKGPARPRFAHELRCAMAPACEILVMVSLLKASLVVFSAAADKLELGYYSETCPNLEEILATSAKLKLAEAPTTPAAVVRLLFHDCFIEGCDASIMITSTPDNLAERDAEVNRDLAGDGFDAVVRAKAAVEAECPGVVSCADILVIIARNFIELTGGPSYPVLKGRKDGFISEAARVQDNLPGSTLNLHQLLRNFKSKGLDMEDLVVLSGAHTFGFAHCKQFHKRLYNFSRDRAMDPRLPPVFASSLKAACPERGDDPGLVLPFDPSTPFAFDNSYYKTLVAGNALLISDETLLAKRKTREMIREFARDEQKFYQEFGAAMQRLSSVGVKVGSDGDVRRDCTAFDR
ncbi:peroxidase 55-like isoform X1 [Selaginella moellendorffii]|nr:peroxidase 55-like isoform X1 [Selaginella moellendorffii]|eukprot:XP_024525354.1 peroxidase 55-like isoform X1 [Selaginella moellendorffii]